MRALPPLLTYKCLRDTASRSLHAWNGSITPELRRIAIFLKADTVVVTSGDLKVSFIHTVKGREQVKQGSSTHILSGVPPVLNEYRKRV